MNDFSKILPTSKLSSMTDCEAKVDLITDVWIYISFRWQSLKQFDRLYFTKEQVNEFFKKKIWTLIDGRIQTSIDEIRGKYSNLFIEWIDELKEAKDIVKNDIKNSILYWKWNSWVRRYLWKKTTDWIEYVCLTPLLATFNSPTESKVKLRYKYDDIIDELSGTPTNIKTLDQIAIELFWVKDASFLNIKNDWDVDSKTKIS